MKVLNFGKWIPIVALALTATYCTKTGGESSLQSLDNFARSADSKLVMNKCGWGLEEAEAADDNFLDELVANDSYVQWGEGVDKDELLPEVRQSLKAIPGVVHLAFFGLHGSFQITKDTSSICAGKLKDLDNKSTFFSEGDSKIQSCWDEVYREVQTDEEETAYEEGFVVYIDPSKESIQHSILRSFGQLLAEHLHRFDLDEEHNGIVKAGADEEFEDYKMRLAEQLLVDVVQSKSGQNVYDLAHYQSMLGAGITTAQNPNAVKAAWDNLRAAEPAQAKEFASYVFAESFDSYYCSPDTRNKMQQDFDDTYSFFMDAVKKVDEAKSLLPTFDDRGQMTAGESGGETHQFSTTYDQAASYGLLFRGFFRGIGRAIGGIARGIGRIGVGIVRGVGRIARGAVRLGGAIIRGAGRVIRGVGRVIGGVIRGTGRVILGIARGAGRIARGALRIGARVIGGAVRGAAILGAWAIRGTGRVIRGLFGPFAYLNACYGFTCGNNYAGQQTDLDNDGIKDRWDLCSNTPKGVKVHSYRHTFTGCAGGQFRDRDIANRLVNAGYNGANDVDKDGIVNDEDKCSNTSSLVEVEKSGDRMGCAEGQLVDAEVIEKLANAMGQSDEANDSTSTSSTELDCNNLSAVRAAGSGICKNHSSGFCYRVGSGRVLYNSGRVACQ